MTEHQRTRVTRFHVGQHVTLTRKGLRQGLQGRALSPNGVVTRVGVPHRFCVDVRRAGLKHPDGYHYSFWRAR